MDDYASSLLVQVAPERACLILAVLAGGGSSEERIAALEAALVSGGEEWKSEIGAWISEIVPVDLLIPEAAQAWRTLVRDALRFFFSHLSNPRLATKLVEQIELPLDTPPEVRLMRLIAKMPGLQKLGQVLARSPRLAQSLRTALSELENGISDVTAAEARRIVVEQIGDRLETYDVVIEPEKLSEASVSAVLRFTWKNPDRERERGVFKVLKPHIPLCFGEDMRLLQQLGEYLASREGGYEFAVRDVSEMITEVRLLLGHELDFEREQETLLVAQLTYRSSIGIRVPRLIRPLCTPTITAMSAESGVKVTEAFPRSPLRRNRIAEQVIEALIAVPMFSREEWSVFHADPHAGNLLYDEPNRELVVLDWALADRLSLEWRRQLVLLAAMVTLRNVQGVCSAVQALSRDKRGGRRQRLIQRCVAVFFQRMPVDSSPGALDAMILLDEIALKGIHFPPALFLFRKILFTLDGVLYDIAGGAVRMDRVLAREFLVRCVASFGVFHSPLVADDFVSLPWNALLYPARSWARKVLAAREAAGEEATGSGRNSRGSRPSPKTRSPRREKSPRQARRPQRSQLID